MTSCFTISKTVQTCLRLNISDNVLKKELYKNGAPFYKWVTLFCSRHDFWRQQLDWACKANGKPLCVHMWEALAFSETRKLFIVRQCCQLGWFHMEYMWFWAQRNSSPKTEGKEPMWNIPFCVSQHCWYKPLSLVSESIFLWSKCQVGCGFDYSSDYNALSKFIRKCFIFLHQIAPMYPPYTVNSFFNFQLHCISP